MDMEVELWSRANVREVLEMLDIIETTRLEDLPDTWRDRTWRPDDHHPGRTGRGGDSVHYDPWSTQKIDEQTASSRAVTTCVLTDDFPLGWVHDDKDVERTHLKTSRDYIRYAFSGTRHYPGNYYAFPSSVGVTDGYGVSHPAVETQNNETVQTSGGADDTAAVSRLL